MNQELARVIVERLEPIIQPYFDVIAGLAKTVEYVQETERGSVTKRMPVASDTVGIEGFAFPLETQLIPDSSKKGIFYVEDNGSIALGGRHSTAYYQTSFTLVGWLNKEKNPGFDHLAALVVSAIRARLAAPFNDGGFVRIMTSVERVLPNDASIFSRYTYDETLVQYLMLPYEYFGLTVRVKFGIPFSCMFPMVSNPTT